MLSLYLPINPTSLGAVGFYLFREFSKQFPDIGLFPIGGIDYSSFEPVDEEIKRKIGGAVENGLRNHSVNNPSLKVWHQFAGIERISNKQTLFTFHELDSLTECELNSLNQQEAIIVPSIFNKMVFERSGVKSPVHHAPLGVDRTVFYPLEKYKNKTGPFVFLMAGKFESRKLHFEIFQAFKALFAGNPQVRLRCAISNRFVNMKTVYDTIIHNIFGGQLPNNIEFIDWLPTERHFADFLCSGDCLVSPSRGESFNLPLLQAMSCGVQVITNADHAHLDYVTEGNATLCKSECTETACDNMFFKNDGRTNTGKWFKITGNEIANSMVKAFQNGRKVNEAGIKTSEEYTWENTVKQILINCNKNL